LSFSTIQLPQGLEHSDRNTTLSRTDDGCGVRLDHPSEAATTPNLATQQGQLVASGHYLSTPDVCELESLRL
jgi:hypothetical protein